MIFFNRILSKIKSLLGRLNSISSTIHVPKQTRVIGSVLQGAIVLQEPHSIVNSNLKGTISIAQHTTIQESKLKGTFTIGANNKINGATLLGVVTTGKFTSLWGPNLDIYSSVEAPVFIGNFCSIARNVTFQTFNHNFKKPTSYFIGQNFFNEKWKDEKVTKGGIILKNDVWIGTHSVILTGVTIENGAVVAANSVVTKDVPAYAIVAGSPAKVIGYRFDPSLIKQLEELAWWDWTEEKIAKNKAFFQNEISSETLTRINHE